MGMSGMVGRARSLYIHLSRTPLRSIYYSYAGTPSTRST